MANVTALNNMRNLGSYLPAGVNECLQGVLRALPPDIVASDAMGLYAFPAIADTKQDVTTTAGARPLAVIALQHGVAVTYIHMWNVQSGSVTTGVNASMVIPLGNTNNEVTAVAFFGGSWKRFWDTGMTIAGSSAAEAAGAPTTPPDVWVLYG